MEKITILVAAALMLTVSCSDDVQTNEPVDVATTDQTSADQDLSDDSTSDDSTSDGPQGCADAICGALSYGGIYDGPSAQIYVRAYKESGSLSANPAAAVGRPDFVTSTDGVGDYRIELEGYEGTLTLSAFMDVDGSGSEFGPNGRFELLHGLYSDPIGAFGGYTFEETAETWPTVIVVGVEGLEGVDIALADSGVIRGTVTGDANGTLVVGTHVPKIGGLYLHHREYTDYVDGMEYAVVAPAKSDWRVRATVGGKTGFYPQNPPPPPPTNTTPVEVVANTVTDTLVIALP